MKNGTHYKYLFVYNRPDPIPAGHQWSDLDTGRRTKVALR